VSKREARLARQAALEAQKERQRMIRIGAIAATGVLAVAAIVWLAMSLSARTPGEAQATNAEISAQEVNVPSEGAAHIPVGQKGTYQHYPPSSGPHWNERAVAPIAWGVYSEPVPAEAFVHNLEHGGIVILYNCPEGCPDTVESLETFAAQVPQSRFGTQKVVISPDPQIPTKVVALAWTRELDLTDFDQARLLEFYKRWVDAGPELAP
jgi:hypothetical protein